MDIGIYTLEDLILTAMKSEIESKEVYSRLADRVSNFMLKDRFKFLAEEEEKHRNFFEWLYNKNFPGKEISLPKKSPVPMPRVDIINKEVPISDIMQSAMEAEKAAYDFYLGISKRFESEQNIQKMLIYIANMEMGHYRILEVEKDNAKRFEDFDFEWPMMHVGP